MPSAWITHVKDYSSKNNISYASALKDPKCSQSYKIKVGSGNACYKGICRRRNQVEPNIIQPNQVAPAPYITREQMDQLFENEVTIRENRLNDLNNRILEAQRLIFEAQQVRRQREQQMQRRQPTQQEILLERLLQEQQELRQQSNQRLQQRLQERRQRQQEAEREEETRPPENTEGRGLKGSDPNKETEILKYSDPDKALENAIKYLKKNITFALSTKKTKKYMVQRPDGKFIHFGSFGQKDYTLTRDKERQRLFKLRNAKWAKQDKYTPGWLSYYILWN